MASTLPTDARLTLGCLADTFLPNVGGAELVLHHLATRLPGYGVDPHVLAPLVRGQRNRLDVPYPVHRYRQPWSKRWLVRQLLVPLAWQHWRTPFDVLHCHAAYPPAFIGQLWKRWSNVPIVVRPHGSDILPGRRICKHPELAVTVRHALTAADAVIAQGQFLRQTMLEMGVPDEKIHVIHNGVDLTGTQAAISSGRVAQRPAWVGSRPYILGLGNLSHRKGFDLLIEAYARLRGVDAALVIVGDGPERTRLQELAAQRGLTDRIHFTGQVLGDEKTRLYHHAECLVVPSRSEPFANVILEGLAAGQIVIGSNVGGNLETILHDQHGLLFASENSAELTATLQRLLTTPALAHRLRAAVPGFIARFDWGVVAGQYAALYRHVAGRGATGPTTGDSEASRLPLDGLPAGMSQRAVRVDGGDRRSEAA